MTNRHLLVLVHYAKCSQSILCEKHLADGQNRAGVAGQGGVAVIRNFTDQVDGGAGREILPGTLFFDAARKTLEQRGDASTGWSMGWKVCC